MGVLFKQESAADLVSTLPLRSLDFSRVPVGLDYLHLLFVQPISHYPDPGTTARRTHAAGTTACMRSGR